MTKRLLNMALILVVCAALLPIAANAATVSSGECGDDLTWTLSSSGTLTVSGTGAMWNYGFSSQSRSPFYGNQAILNVVIKNGVTSISDALFVSCTNLICVSIPASVLSVGEYAFFSCGNLKKIIYNGNEEQWNLLEVDSIPTYTIIEFGSCECGDDLTWTLDDAGKLTIDGTGAMWNFENASSTPWYGSRNQIKAVIVQNGVTSIGNYAFYGCTSMQSAEISGSVTSIGTCAFFNCSALRGVRIPGSVRSIGERAFAWCGALYDLKIEYGVQSIGVSAFSNCASLKKARLPGSVTSVALGNSCLTFDPNGGSGTMDSLLYGEPNATLPDSSFTPPAGKVFAHWEIGGEQYKAGSSVYVISPDTVAVAFWKDAPYTVTYDPNGGSGTMEPQGFADPNATLPECEFTPPQGKVFANWQVNGEDYDAGSSVYLISPDTVAVAFWKRIAYTVTYSANGGSGTMDSATVNDG
ncbi:MAG: leucine-rich repeat domain-containing protein, partial [Oscillospiraceae bacterium]|nr:leucine-rich repeat domain-containing protein [Oscillospiraceae bacterium]